MAYRQLFSSRLANIRTVTTSASEHAPKIKLYGIPARYANATYVVASQANKLIEVESDLIAFRDALKKNAAFESYLSNPTISRSEKVVQLESIFENSKINEISKNLFTTLAANARLHDVSRVIDAFGELMRAKRGEVDVVVTLAEPLTDALEKSLLAALKKQIGETSKIMLTTKINPSIIGGLTVQIGDKFMDLSIAAKLKETKTILTGAAS